MQKSGLALSAIRSFIVLNLRRFVSATREYFEMPLIGGYDTFSPRFRFFRGSVYLHEPCRGDKRRNSRGNVFRLRLSRKPRGNERGRRATYGRKTRRTERKIRRRGLGRYRVGVEKKKKEKKAGSRASRGKDVVIGSVEGKPRKLAGCSSKTVPFLTA